MHHSWLVFDVVVMRHEDELRFGLGGGCVNAIACKKIKLVNDACDDGLMILEPPF